MATEPLNILVVDDDRSLLDVLETLLRLEGHTVAAAQSASEALQAMQTQEFSLVLADLKMPRTSGLDLLRLIKQQHPETRVVIMTAYASVDNTVEAMRLGVFDYLPKPFKLADLRAVIEKAGGAA